MTLALASEKVGGAIESRGLGALAKPFTISLPICSSVFIIAPFRAAGFMLI